MNNPVLKMRILFILGCMCIALGVFLWGAGIDLGAFPLGLGIFFMGFWTFIMAVNPELKDYKEIRNQNKNIK